MPILRVRSHSLAAGRPGEIRRIELRCDPSGGGEPASAAIEFGPEGAAAVGYVTGNADGRVRVSGWFPRRHFRRIRAILSRGGPLQLFFDLRDPGTGAGYLTRVGLAAPQGVLAAVTSPPVPALPGRTPGPTRFATA